MNIIKGNRVAIIGAGAAGLVCLKVLVENGFDVTAFEQSNNVGGVWNYAESTAMYDSLRTNLPKEIMAFSIEDPFVEPAVSDSEKRSFVTHSEVQHYLETFVHTYQLKQYIRFSHSVKHVHKQTNSEHWTLDVSSHGQSTNLQFDAVIVCNGHFNIPYTPHDTPGMEHFTGETYHSSEYDRIKHKLTGKNVLVVGSMSSGTDMARELLTIASTVIVSDRSSSCDVHAIFSNVPPNLHVLSGIECVREDGSVLFTGGETRSVDAVLWCTGYLYDYPFLRTDHTPHGVSETCDNINDNTNTLSGDSVTTPLRPLPCPVEVALQRCVRPLYQQLFSVRDPSLAFVGLPFRVVPFPMFYYQGGLCQYVFVVLFLLN